jgi:hypothetical protein
MYGFGVAAADYDNDGRVDIYVTALEGDRLFHNEGNCHFRDVTAESGIHNVNFGTSAAWFDYDKDGKADLIVANYATWSQKTISGAHWMVRRNRIARPNRTKGRRRGCITTWAAASLKMSRKRRD